jgi:hypothetical protein
MRFEFSFSVYFSSLLRLDAQTMDVYTVDIAIAGGACGNACSQNSLTTSFITEISTSLPVAGYRIYTEGVQLDIRVCAFSHLSLICTCRCCRTGS